MYDVICNKTALNKPCEYSGAVPELPRRWHFKGKAIIVYLDMSYYWSTVGVMRALHIVGQMYFC